MERPSIFLSLCAILLLLENFCCSGEAVEQLMRGCGEHTSPLTLCFDANTLYPVIIAGMMLFFLRIRRRAPFTAVFVVLPVVTIAVLLSLGANKAADAGFYLDGLVVLLLDAAVLFARVRATDGCVSVAAARLVLALLYVKFSAAVFFLGYGPIGGIEARTSFYVDFLVIFSTTAALLLVQVRTSDAEAPLAPAAVIAEVVLVLHFAKFAAAAAAALIGPCRTNGIKAHWINYFDGYLGLLAAVALSSVRVWVPAPAPAPAARARRASAAVLLAFLFVKFVAAVFFSSYSTEEGMNADVVVRLDPNLLVLYTAAAGVLVFDVITPPPLDPLITVRIN